ncbi:type IV secretory system conjugative DNA transfer family protein [uncultured Desulfovibrio sp.]|uniref:type IV secretory system conjugative DNA transfer family protein n=1 Tax=uncultured Desulfovibrio sp. TaxID=167968 RepID=UPI00260AEEA5|nr:type IV secretory system conjugative DNA transfer family protein [uncultured Desulfovibrio sp.]
MAQQEYGLQESAPDRRTGIWWLLFLLLPALTLLGMSMATLKAASDYGFQPALGHPWFSLFGIPFHAPWSIFTWEGISPAVMDNALTVGQAFFIVPLMFAMLCVAAFRKLKGNKSLHGSARWARKDEIERMGYFGGKGVYVGGWFDKRKDQLLYLRHNGPEHVLCFAPTRSGKGVGLILPTLLSWPGSSLTLDIKGENWALTSGWRKSQEHRVLRFDPSDASGSGCAFNPLDEIRLSQLEAVQDVQNLALMLVDPDGKGLEDHWTKAAFAFFAGLILHCCVMVRHKEGRMPTLQDLTIMMSDPDRTPAELLDEMMATDHAKLFREFAPDADTRVGDACHIFIASAAREMASKAENEASGVLSSALVNMAIYRDPIININTARSDFHIHDLMNDENPVDLYLVIPPDGIDRVRPLIRLMLDLIIRRVCARMEFADGTSKAGYKHRLLLMLDEFTSLGKLPIMEKAIAYIAGYGGKIYIIVQDPEQLNKEYSKENAIMANCHVRIAYAPNKTETAEMLSKLVGKTTVVEKKTSISIGKGGRTRSINMAETARPLLTPDECSRLRAPEKDSAGRITRAGDMLILTAGQYPIFGMQILYFKDPTFSQRSKIPAPGVSEKYPAGITDSLYFPRPAEWYDKRIEETPGKKEETGKEEKSVSAANFEDFLKQGAD